MRTPTHARAAKAAMPGLALAALVLGLTPAVAAQDDAPPDFDSDLLEDDADPFEATEDDAFARAAEDSVAAGPAGDGDAAEGGQGAAAPGAEGKKTPGPAALAAMAAIAGVALALRRK